MLTGEAYNRGRSPTGGNVMPRAMPSLCALVAALLLFACARFSSDRPPNPSLVCHSAQQCVIQAEVKCPQTPCTISVTHQNVRANNHDIVWEIVPKAGQSYKFKGVGGIFFKTAG